MKRTILPTLVLMVFTFFAGAQNVTDYDGNIYDTVNIGGRIWLKQNLRVTHYNDGTPIPNVSDNLVWGLLTTGARCYYGHDSASNDSVYGALYNFFAVSNPALICPPDYHIPTDAEWTAMESFLGGSIVAGGPLKETGFFHWMSPNVGASNSSGFTALPAGGRMPNHSFGYIHENGIFWTSTASGANAYGRYVWYMFAGVERDPYPKRTGVSIRCIRNFGVGTSSIQEPENIQIYPNPAKESITISNPGSVLIEVMVLSPAGVTISSFSSADNQIKLGMEHNAPGMYILRINNGGICQYLKIIKD
jgi:uncharacterized protein (TIGR02145 family)